MVATTWRAAALSVLAAFTLVGGPCPGASAQSASAACPLASVSGNPMSAPSPASPPASNSIAFVTTDGDLGWFSITDATQRVLVPGPVHAPSWSHDSTRIAYVREGGSSKGDRVEVVNRDGSGRVVVLPPQPNPNFQPPDPYTEPFIGIEQVRWAPDDSALYFATNQHNIVGHEICRVDLATGAVSDLMWGLLFDVGPDGSIAVGNFTNNGPPDHPGQWISLVSPPTFDCSSDCALTNPPQTGYFPAWSPDGSTVAFNDDRQRVWIVGRNGDSGRFLNLGFNVDALSWSPDGATLAVAGDGGIWRVDAVTGAKQRIADGAWPSWGGGTR
jgi:dipeptidyl aminopeptidase/acylaminoacyl peptidase